MAPDGRTVPAGDGVRGGMLPRTKFVEIFVTVDTVGGVGARIEPRGVFMLVTVICCHDAHAEQQMEREEKHTILLVSFFFHG